MAEEKKKGGLTQPMKLSDDLANIVGEKETSRVQCVKVGNNFSTFYNFFKKCIFKINPENP